MADFVWHEQDPVGKTHEIVLAPPGSALDLGQPDWQEASYARLLVLFWPLLVPFYVVRLLLGNWIPFRGLLGTSWRVTVVRVGDKTLRWVPPRPYRQAFDSEEAARARVEEVRREVRGGTWAG